MRIWISKRILGIESLQTMHTSGSALESASIGFSSILKYASRCFLKPGSIEHTSNVFE